ncbi:MAG TPA: hypothetical protein VFF12_15735 [Myxococcaceae bacterium]|nr:hypothetical protein [Myxococcaceae bacterium]
MMLEGLFSMLPFRSWWAVLALGSAVLSGCGPGAVSETVPEAVATARALVRPHVARNALTVPAANGSSGGTAVSPGPTSVVLGHRASDGTLRVGCVDTEDGAEALVRDAEDSR